MDPLWLLLVPISLGLIAGLLAATSWLEESMLTPQRMILASVRARRAPVEHVEAFVAREAERLLKDLVEPDPDPTPAPAPPAESS